MKCAICKQIFGNGKTWPMNEIVIPKCCGTNEYKKFSERNEPVGYHRKCISKYFYQFDPAKEGCYVKCYICKGSVV